MFHKTPGTLIHRTLMRRGRWIYVLGLPSWLLWGVGSACGGNACVHFDVAETVACQPVEVAEESGQLSGGEMLITAKFEVSSLIRLGREDDLLQFLYVVESPQRTAQVVDYAPRTQLATSVAGHVNVQRQTERSNSLGLNATAQVSPLLSGSTNGSTGSKVSASTHYELLPPMELLAASGTIARGTAVYFKLKPSTQTSLDGSRQFSVVLRVSRDWRADYVRLRCIAFGRHGGGLSPSDGEPICGSSEFLVGIYREADPQAQAAAQQLARAERTLKTLARTRHKAIDRQRYGSVTDMLAIRLNLSQPRIPDEWLQQVLRGESTQRQYGFQQHLPDDVRQAVQDFTDARWKLHQLSRPSSEIAQAL